MEEELNQGNPPKSFLQLFDKVKQSSTTPNQIQSNNIVGYNTGIGESKYDEDFIPNVSLNSYEDLKSVLNEQRAQSQSNLAKVGAGIGRIANKAVTEILKMPGVVGGIAMAPFAEEGEGWETAFNNQWIKSISKLNEDINTELLPVYVKKAVSEGDLIDNITSIDFWATEGADGIGFIASMFAPGTALKSLNLGHKVLGTTAKGLSMINGEAKLAGAVRTLEGLGITANNIDLAGITMANTLFESGAEAGSAMDNFQKDLDSKLASGEISQEEYTQLETQKAKLGRDIFVSNLAILLVPNAIQSKMIWGKGLGSTLVKDSPSLMTKIGNRTKNILGATASEGFLEEGTQSTVETMFSDKAKKGELTNNITKDFNISELVSSYIDTLSTTDGQKAIFLGGFLGGGMSAYQGAKSDIATRKQTEDVLNLAQERVGVFNKINETDVYKRDTNGDIVYNFNNQPQYDPVKVVEVAKALNYTDQQNKIFDQAIREGNEEVIQTLKDQAINQLITPFINTGELGIQALSEYLDQTLKTEEISENEDAKTLKTKIIEKANYMQDQLDSYKDFSKSLINIKNPNASPQDITDYYNTLGDLYINLKGSEYFQKEQLKKLNIQKSKLLKDLGQSELSTELNPNYIEGTTEEIYKFKKNPVDPRVKLLNDQIEETNSNLSEIDKIINDQIWDNEKVNKAFNDKFKQDVKLREEFESDQPNQIDALIDNINNTSIIEESQLDKIIKDNKELSNVPVVSEVISKKRQEIINLKKFQEDLKKQEQHDANVIKEEENPSNGVTDVITNEDVPLNTNTESIQTNDIAEVGEFDEIIETSPKEFEEIPENDSLQPGAKVISTNRNTGESITGLESFVEYERTPRDKTKDKVTFDLGDVKDNNIFTIFKKLEWGESLSIEQIILLENSLPIKVTFNGEVSSFIEDMASSSKSIVEKETLPLRKAIVAALIQNKGSFEGIEGSIVKQFPGVLKIDSNNRNNIFDLNVFKDMTEDQKVKYFQNNTGYSNYKGEFLSAKTGEVIEGPEFKKNNARSHKGELFLKIPMNNGKPFWLKLNSNTISQEKANSLFELMMIKFRLSEEPSLDELEQYLITNDLTELLYSLNTEIELIKSNEPLRVNQSVDKLIDLLIYNGNENIKTKFKIDFAGSQVEVGTLFGKLNETPDIHTITSSELLADPEFYRDKFINFFKYKRHNILFSNGDTANFGNKNYINYLLNESDPILTTNAVVNEPTFGGYSNIYLNRNFTNSNKVENTPIVEDEKDFDINFIFNQNKELSKIGSKQQYRKYLNTIFPNSKVKDIVYHGSQTENIEKIRKEGFIIKDESSQIKNNIFFGNIYNSYSNSMTGDNTRSVIPALVNINKVNIIENAVSIEIDKYYKDSDGLIVFGDSTNNYDPITNKKLTSEDKDFISEKIRNNFYKNISEITNQKIEDIQKQVENLSSKEDFDSYINTILGYINNNSIKGIPFEQLSTKIENVYFLGTNNDLENFKKYISNSNNQAIDVEEIDKLLNINNDIINIESVEDNRQKLINELNSLITTNPREYAKRLVDIVDSSNGKLTKRDIKEGAEFIIDKMIESGLPIEGQIIKKDC